jgi:hypothetical protein
MTMEASRHEGEVSTFVQHRIVFSVTDNSVLYELLKDFDLFALNKLN